MKIIAIIPARSGSKGVPDKNIKELLGKPLLAYTIESAIKSGVFEEIMVSTDSESYAEIAKGFGANVPFLRSEYNSRDEASSWDAVYEVIRGYGDVGREFDAFMLLQPTSPLRDEDDIVGAVDEYAGKDAVTVVSVCESEHPPVYMNTIPESLSMDRFFGDHRWTRRQDIPTYYRLNGAIYMSDVRRFMEHRDIYRERCFAYIMDQRKSVDIDSELDFLYVEAVMRERGDEA